MMPISATGNRGPKGFTLVELMVVLAIVGLMTTIVVLNLPSAEANLGREADRFAARLTHARDSAILSNRQVAAVINSGGYSFVRRAGESWQAIDEKPLTPARWQSGTRPQLAGAEVRVTFDSVGMAEPQRIALLNDEHRVSIRIGGGGEVRVDGR